MNIMPLTRVNEKIAGNAGAVFLPAAPAREVFWGHVRVPGFFRGSALPGVPIEVCGGEIRRRRILPRTVGIIAAVGAFYESELADGALGEELLGFGADDGADALRANLHDLAGIFEGFHHFDAILRGVGHRLFAVDGLAGTDRVDDDLLVPMIGDGGEDAVDFLVVEEIFVAARDGKIGVGGNFASEQVAAVVKIGSGDAFNARESESVGQYAGAFHAHADDAEAETVAGRDGGIGGCVEARVVEEDGVCGSEGAGGGGSAVEELAAGEVFFHWWSPEGRKIGSQKSIPQRLKPQVNAFECRTQGPTSGALTSIHFRGCRATSLKKTMSLSL
jgi:hypothetical protein